MAPGRRFTRDTTIYRQQAGPGSGSGSGSGWHRPPQHTGWDPSVPSTHLAILQGHNPGVLRGADDVVIPCDALQSPWPKSLKAVPLGGYRK